MATCLDTNTCKGVTPWVLAMGLPSFKQEIPDRERESEREGMG